MMMIENHIVPVYRHVAQKKTARVERLYGTAFFINDQGVFVTAKHVLDEVFGDIKSNGGTASVPVCRPEDRLNRYVGEIIDWSTAEPPFDIAVGIIDKPTLSAFDLGTDINIMIWDDIYAVGYPETSTTIHMGRRTSFPRGLKGHVTRKVPAGNFLLRSHPDVIEVNFAIPSGCSGAPLVMRHQEAPEDEQETPFVLLGVCVGNETSEFIDFASEEITDGGVTQREVIKKVEQYGIVHDLRPLAEWKPDCLNGQTLGEAIS